MATVIENILLGKHYVSVEFFSLNNEEKIAFLEVQKKSNELVVSKKYIYDSREKLTEVKSKFPAVLIINNEQVLQKVISGNDGNDKKLLNNAFPNLQSENFYYEIWRRENTSVVAICRKIYVDELLISIKSVLKVTSVNLGITSLSQLESFDLPLLITTNTQEVFLDDDINNAITETVPDFAEYAINGLQIPNTHLLGFSGILSLLLPHKTAGSIAVLQSKLNENYRQGTFFEKGLKAAIVLLLVLLLGNFFLFTYYFDKATAISETVSLNKTGIENISKIKQRIKDKEQKLESFTNNASSGSSVIINSIVKEMPSFLLLNELAYHPLEKKIKEDEAITTRDSLITVSGATLSNEAFTSWVGNIEKQSKVDNITITSFAKNEENKSVFSLKITLKK